MFIDDIVIHSGLKCALRYKFNYKRFSQDGLEEEFSQSSTLVSSMNLTTDSQFSSIDLVRYEEVVQPPTRSSLVSDPTAQVLVNTDTIPDEISPYPARFRDAWDSDHVRLPHSPCNRIKSNRNAAEVARWNLITQTLKQKINSPAEFEEAVYKYNTKIHKPMGLMRYFFEKEARLEERTSIFVEISRKSHDIPLV